MRRLRYIGPIVLVLGLTAIYLWQVEGWGRGSSNAKPAEKIDPNQVEIDGSVSADATVEELAAKAPVELLRRCLVKYHEAGVKGYTCTFVMHEKVKGKQKPTEVIDCWFKEEPFSVFMHWKQGADLACASLYVHGENKGNMCVRPTGAAKLIGWVGRPPDDKQALESARYMITEFGLRCGTERTYKAWRALKEKGVHLNVVYVGKQPIEELDGRECHVIKRYCDPPEEEGLTEITLYIDAETWFQTGSVLKAGDQLIGKYFFKNIQINPEFEEKRFKPETLKKY